MSYLLSFGADLSLGSDDILCCFVVGNSFNWDGYFGGENGDQAFQEVMDGYLNTVSYPHGLANARSSSSTLAPACPGTA